MEGMVNREVWIPSIKMLSGDITYYSEYGRCFLIGYCVFKLENFLLLAERAKENIWRLKYCWRTKQGRNLFTTDLLQIHSTALQANNEMK